MDVYTLFSQARKLDPQNEKYIGELQEFEEYIEDDAYDIDAFRTDFGQICDGYLKKKKKKNIHEALNVFTKITSIINNNDWNDGNKLIHKQKFNKFNHFTKIKFTIVNNNNILDKYIPIEYNKLKLFELICININISLSDYLISNYHSSGLTINEYISQNQLFQQLRIKYDLLPNNQNKSNKYNIMTNYLYEYEKHIYKPLNRLQYLNENTINKYNDNITIIINYIIEINNGIHNILLSEKASYPIQFGIFFVAPNMYTELNLHSLNGLCDEIKSDLYSRKNGAVNGIADIYRLLRRAANNINRLNHQRFSMLIVRNNKYDTTADTIYIYKNNNKYISDNVELTYLLNTKLTPIIPGHRLYSNNKGILSLTHHLHSNNISKCYLGYNDFKSRIFKYNFLNSLQLIFNSNNFRISENKRTDFNNSYKNFNDLNYKNGEYYFKIKITKQLIRKNTKQLIRNTQYKYKHKQLPPALKHKASASQSKTVVQKQNNNVSNVGRYVQPWSHINTQYKYKEKQLPPGPKHKASASQSKTVQQNNNVSNVAEHKEQNVGRYVQPNAQNNVAPKSQIKQTQRQNNRLPILKAIIIHKRITINIAMHPKINNMSSEANWTFDDDYHQICLVAFDEINSIRQNPQNLIPNLKEIEKDMIKNSDKIWRIKQMINGKETIRNVQISEGKTLIRETISFLQKQKPVGKLKENKELAISAMYPIQYSKQINAKTGHIFNHKNLHDAKDRERQNNGRRMSKFGENIMYRLRNGRDIILGLLIDDNTPNRGHREKIFKEEWSEIGFAAGLHSEHGFMCVSDFAAFFVKNNFKIY